MTLVAHWQDPSPLLVRPPEVTGIRVVDETLARRGFTTAEAAHDWLNPDLDVLAEQANVPGLDAVVERILGAVRTGERIVIFGDYDCDGVTSTATLFSALRWASPEPSRVTWRLPTRSEGYGLRDSQVEAVTSEGSGLLITVDCGSNDIETIAAVRAQGMDVAVVDHHQISATLPDDIAFANPHRAGDMGTTQLTAAGLSWLVVHKLAHSGVRVGPNGEQAKRYLDLAAIGTVGDVAQLTGVNRVIVREGLEQLRHTKRSGLRALARGGKFDLASLTAEDIPYRVTPRLNAPGRLGAPDVALKLLLAADWDSGQEFANEVLSLDKQRKHDGELILTEALAMLEGADTLDDVIVVSGDAWHCGLLGPAAAKLVERFGRPSVVVGGNGGTLAGSGRSVEDWDIAAAFRAVSAYLTHHGGHAGAAGLSVARDQLDNFRTAINAYARIAPITPPAPEHIDIDADLNNDEVTFGLARAIEGMAPFGRGNPRPVLRWRGVRVSYLRTVGKDKATVQMQLQRGDANVRAVMFKGADRIDQLSTGEPLDVLVQIAASTWNGSSRVEATVVDFQLSP